jgi:hypothetical protein
MTCEEVEGRRRQGCISHTRRGRATAIVLTASLITIVLVLTSAIPVLITIITLLVTVIPLLVTIIDVIKGRELKQEPTSLHGLVASRCPCCSLLSSKSRGRGPSSLTRSNRVGCHWVSSSSIVILVESSWWLQSFVRP